MQTKGEKVFGLFDRGKKERQRLKGEIQELKEDVARLEREKATLKLLAESNSHQARIKKLEEMLKSIPTNARGRGQIAVLKDDKIQFIELKSRSDLEKVIKDAKKGKLEIIFA